MRARSAHEVVPLEVSDMQEGATCERGTCPPSHRLARKISTFVMAALVLALIACGAYLWWSQSQ